MKVQYYIIASLDIVKGVEEKLSRAKPDFLKSRKFRVTETKVEYGDRKYFSGHRKYCGTVSAEGLAEIKKEIGWIDTCRTGGSIGEYGCIPAISWDDSNSKSLLNLYVSPLFSYDNDIEEKLYKTLSKRERMIKDSRNSEYMDKIMGLLLDGESEEFLGSFEDHPEQTEMDFYWLEVGGKRIIATDSDLPTLLGIDKELDHTLEDIFRG
jgi:hypothetical protein